MRLWWLISFISALCLSRWYLFTKQQVTEPLIMSGVTEIASLQLKSGVKPETAAHKVTSLVLQQPGALRARWATRIENAEYLTFFIDWEDVSAHKAFMGTPAYNTFLEDIGEDIAATPAIYHAAFVPFPPTVLNNDSGRGKTAVSEVCHAYFPADTDLVQQQEILARFQQFIDGLEKLEVKGFSGEVAYGFVLEDLDFKGEKARAAVLVLGWDSVDAHMAFRDTEAFQKTIPIMRTLPNLKGMEMWHVKNTDITK